MKDPSIALKIFVYFAWFTSVASMLLGLAVRASQRLRNWVRSIPLDPWGFTTIALVASSYLLLLSQQLSGIVKYEGSVPIIDSFVSTIRLFGANADTPIVADVLAEYLPKNLTFLYNCTNSMAHAAAPIDALMGVFLLVTGFINTPLLRIESRNRDTYVFSELTSQSLIFATSIANHYETTKLVGESDACLIVFANTKDQNKSARYEEAVSKAMLCVNHPIAKCINLLDWSKARRVFIISGDDESNNLQNGIAFAESLAQHELSRKGTGQRPRPEVRILSSSATGENFIDATAAKIRKMSPDKSMPLVSVRRLNRLRGTIDSLLWQYPLFLVEKPSKDVIPQATDPFYTKTKRRIAIVGSGTIGSDFLKAAIWCSKLDGLRYAVDIIGLPRDQLSGIKLARDHFGMDAPEIAHLSTGEPGSEYEINFLGLNAEGESYFNYLKSNRNELTYVLIALGNDLLNAKVAKRTREILEQGRYSPDRSADCVDRPLICTVIDSNAIANSVEQMQTSRGVNYEIIPVGTGSNTYSYDNLFEPEIDLMGRNVNRAYWGYYSTGSTLPPEDATQLRRQADASYERFEYNQRSSRATAIHLKYTLFAYIRRHVLSSGVVPDVSTADWQGRLMSLDSKAADNKAMLSLIDRYQAYVDHATDEELDWITIMEHDRWTAYVRSEGYEVADEQTFNAFFADTGENQNRMSRQHVCLVPFEDLQATSDFVYKMTNKMSDRDYEHLDDEIVLNLKHIAGDLE
ncbi:MAG: hypothetical protein J6D34_04405 [Atopobiaceae bacterium]|nr:hypothetical protein [Atopobiaceae bacterium]